MVKRSCCNDGTCTAILLQALMIIKVCVHDSTKNFEKYEKFMQTLQKVVQEGRKEGATRYFVAGDLNVELGPLCMHGGE